ncbi:L,D-transpeptidase family protein [Neobacillus sp. PS3-40]|uniref:L,D-transpeptidase family protein n=1 Tax=Neobacillus sp. PS3-40 TaxID=3070679 RepID=UPI0027E18EE7|nr:L,D-transpeptidase family protein [Neobacillus sp. PS3-40]WML44327.1 L,D-transpeptidase family protein [Neobacillus sp. PS3-40]
MRKIKIIIISSLIMIIALVFAGIYYYQSTRFNSNITINDTKVGGLTADQAIKKLKSTVLKNVVFVGQEQIFDGKDTKMEFTNNDMTGVKKLLRRQQTFFPTSKAKSYLFIPGKADYYQSKTMKKKIEEKLILMNKGLKAPQDAEAHLEQGKMIVSKSINGKQFDVASLVKDYQKQEFNSEIHLNAVYLQPIKADSPIVKQEMKMLQELVQRTIDYKVQNKDYSFIASDLIKNASVSKKMKYSINTSDIQKKVAEIDRSQSTLNKNYTFKTHSGSVISVKGESYGWAIDVGAETKRIQEAFEKGEKAILAYNIYGIGWNTYGIGYHNPTNNGIGNTYAEVSIKEQRIWIYKNGQLKVTTPVVTGRHDTHEDTPKGLWYIMFKESPSILQGSEVGNPNYSVKVDYWAPFTLGGVGFHDASWRKNWASTAYLKKGSGGCVNTPPSIMKAVYDNLAQNEPVVVY